MYYDLEKNKYINDSEERKNIANELDRPKINKCEVCAYSTYCKNKTYDQYKNYLKGCNDFILDELNIFSELYKKQQKL